MGFITDKIKKLKPELSYVEVNSDKQKTLESLYRLKSQLEKLINALQQFQNINYIRVEILKNYCKVPNFDIKLYDPIFANSVIHSPIKLNVKDLKKFDVNTPVVNQKLLDYVELPNIPEFVWTDYPDINYPDEPEPPEDETATPVSIPNQTPEPTATPTPTETPVSDAYFYNTPYDETVPTPMINPFEERYPTQEETPEKLPANLQSGIPNTLDINLPAPVPSEPVITPDGDKLIPDTTIIWFPNPVNIEGVKFPNGTGHPVMTIDKTGQIKIGWVDDNGVITDFKTGKINVSDTFSMFVYDLLMATLLAGASEIATVGEIADISNVIRGIGAVGWRQSALSLSSSMLLTDWQSLLKLKNNIARFVAVRILTKYLWRAAYSQSDCTASKWGYKIALILSKIYPNELTVKENGMIFVNPNSEILRQYVSGDIETQPIIIPNYNCDWAEPLRFVLLSNEPFKAEDIPDTSPDELYKKIFNKSIEDEISYWALKVMSWGGTG